MFKVKLDSGRVLSFKWRHYKHGESPEEKIDHLECNRVTRCLELRENKWWPMGYKVVEAGEQFCKEKARKASLASALKFMGLTKDDRRRVWEAYLDRDAAKRLEAQFAKLCKILSEFPIPTVDDIFAEIQEQMSDTDGSRR
jgi:hypothetical protein